LRYGHFPPPFFFSTVPHGNAPVMPEGKLPDPALLQINPSAGAAHQAVPILAAKTFPSRRDKWCRRCAPLVKMNRIDS
jgi:hypothetical protein